ncbi:Bax inhibitor-1/YccA family protein [Aquipuribacter sp. SD81]|uniref:Bax inhibitor-1/YccA family protein n=1 Tax=Aquipuribacter sp. SD81 TaxID=3127703 RepID=UPI0030193BA2
MRSSNPAFSRNEAFTRGGYATFDVATPSSDQLESQYGMPSAVRERPMTIEDVVNKGGILFAVLLAVAVPVYFLAPPSLLFPLWIGGIIATLVLGMVIAFSKTPKPGLMVLYAAVEGAFVGAISAFYAAAFAPNLIPQAVLGTLAAFAAMLLAYRTGLIRASGRFKKVLLIAALGYFIFSLVNIGFVLFAGTSFFFDTGILGVGLSLLGVTLASLFLVLDFDFIEQGIRNRLPAQYAWTAAFGLMVTLVWLYLEILRLLAILRGSD